MRLKGTAADFFSRNPDKPFPRSDADCRVQAEASGSDGSMAEARWNDSPYATTSDLPNRCFWDCRYRLGIDPAPSDYDVQISSDTLAETLRTKYPDGTDRGRPIVSEHGGHYKDAAMMRTFPALATWSARWQERLGREVNMAGFSADGSTTPVSRFDDSNWVIIS